MKTRGGADRVAVVGGGAAGMAAAIAAAECGDRVTIIERMDRVGKKLLATGNGRGNLMNTGVPDYPGGSVLAEAVLTLCGAEELRRFWRHLGLSLREEEGGRVYPASGQAATALDVLRLRLEQLGVAVETGRGVTGLHRGEAGWLLDGDDERSFDRVIVCAGGMAQPKLGSDGSGYALLTGLGHRLIPCFPALTQIETDRALIRGLEGIRVKAEITVTSGGRQRHREAGELLFTDYGVSGICAMGCARVCVPLLTTLEINLLPGLGMDSLSALLRELGRRREAHPGLPLRELMTGLCVPRLSSALLKAAGLRGGDRPIGELPDADLERLARVCAGFALRVTGVRGFDSAQVTAGGIACEDFVPETMASRLAEGIHAAGEVLDVDGGCGGFNLMFAFSSGILAGLNGRKADWLLPSGQLRMS